MLDWQQLVPDGSFRDPRLRHRAVALLEGIYRSPGEAFASVFRLRKDVKAAYRFCENPAVSFATLLTPTFLALGRALRELGDQTILCLHDTTELELSRLEMEGLGEVGNPGCQGLLLHSGLAVSTSGLPLGLLAASTWVRDPAEHGKRDARHNRPFDEKESARWWWAIEFSERMVASLRRLLHVADREADIFDVMARCAAASYRFLFRAAQDRLLADAVHRQLWACAESWRVRLVKEVEIPMRPARAGRPARKARTALLAIRFGAVDIEQYRKPGMLPVWAVLAREENPPDGEEPIEWLLLTNDPINTAEEALLRVQWYRLRWRIEDYHKCFKSVCEAESRQFEEREHFEIFLAMCLLVSCRLLYLRDLAREAPDTPALAILTEEEQEVLVAESRKNGKRVPPGGKLTVRDAVRLLAMLGGFLGRKNDGEPGFQTLAHGYLKFWLIVEGWRLARGLPSRDHFAFLASRPIPTAGTS